MRKLRPVTPGELLLEEFLKPMSVSQYRLAKRLACLRNASAASWPAIAPSPLTPICACAASSACPTVTGCEPRRPTTWKSHKPLYTPNSPQSRHGRALALIKSRYVTPSWNGDDGALNPGNLFPSPFHANVNPMRTGHPEAISVLPPRRAARRTAGAGGSLADSSDAQQRQLSRNQTLRIVPA